MTGTASIDKDYKAFNAKVYHALQAGLTAVGSELTKQLQRHVKADVYEAYTPKAYERRMTAGGLIDSRYMRTSQKSMSVELSYVPIGYNHLYPGAYKNGDDLIDAIENSNYTWEGTEGIPERHFWNDYVEEAVGKHGWSEKLLVSAMNRAERDLNVKADGNIRKDGNDTLIARRLSIDDLIGGSDDNDGDLPY